MCMFRVTATGHWILIALYDQTYMSGATLLQCQLIGQRSSLHAPLWRTPCIMVAGGNEVAALLHRRHQAWDSSRMPTRTTPSCLAVYDTGRTTLPQRFQPFTWSPPPNL